MPPLETKLPVQADKARSFYKERVRGRADAVQSKMKTYFIFFLLLAIAVTYMWALSHAANNSAHPALHGNSKFGVLRVPRIFGGLEPELFAAPAAGGPAPALGAAAVVT